MIFLVTVALVTSFPVKVLVLTPFEPSAIPKPSVEEAAAADIILADGDIIL